MLAQNIGRCYFDEKLNLCITRTSQEAEQCKTLWCTKEDVDELDDEVDVKALGLKKWREAKKKKVQSSEDY